MDYYFEHGRNLSRIVRALGYLSRTLLSQWLDEAVPGKRKLRTSGAVFSAKQKQAAIMDLCLRDGSAQDVADKHGVTRAVVYKWKKSLLEDKDGLETKLESLMQLVEALEEQVYRLRLEKDVLEVATEVSRKDPSFKWSIVLMAWWLVGALVRARMPRW